MKKIILFMFIFILGCGKESYQDQKSPPVETREVKVEKNLNYQIENLSKKLNAIYSKGENLNYQFVGSDDATVKIFITGKELVVPILYETVENSLVLSISILINLETNEKQILVDNLIINYNQFKKIIDKSALWISKTETFSSKFLLEKSLDEAVEVSFPQNDKKNQLFNTFMIFGGERNKNELVLRSDRKEEFQTVISFKRNKIFFLNNKLSEEFILGAILENIKKLESEIDLLSNTYDELDNLLK